MEFPQHLRPTVEGLCLSQLWPHLFRTQCLVYDSCSRSTDLSSFPGDGEDVDPNFRNSVLGYNYLHVLGQCRVFSYLRGYHHPLVGLIILFIYFYFVCVYMHVWYWGLNPGPHSCKLSSLPLSYSPSPVFYFILFYWVLRIPGPCLCQGKCSTSELHPQPMQVVCIFWYIFKWVL